MKKTSENYIKGVIFDLDGTLYSMKLLKFRMFWALFLSVKYLRRLFSCLDAIRLRQFDDAQALMDALYKELARVTGSSVSEARYWYNECFLSAFVNILQKHGNAREGLEKLLFDLKKKGVKLAVISDFSRVTQRIEAIGLDSSVFNYVGCSEDWGVLKPSELPMLQVAKDWGLKCNEILIVGDRDDRDGECARRANMDFVGIQDVKTNMADFYFWDEASQIICRKTGVGESI